MVPPYSALLAKPALCAHRDRVCSRLHLGLNKSQGGYINMHEYLVAQEQILSPLLPNAVHCVSVTALWLNSQIRPAENLRFRLSGEHIYAKWCENPQDSETFFSCNLLWSECHLFCPRQEKSMPTKERPVLLTTRRSKYEWWPPTCRFRDTRHRSKVQILISDNCSGEERICKTMWTQMKLGRT